MVMCEGTDSDGEPRFCFCFSRQIRGCEDPLMKVSKRNKKELFEMIDDLIC